MIEQTFGIGETIRESTDEPAHIVDEPAQAQANGN